ncbi:dihydrofolate reductase [Blattabacterium cuenoti]|uniref:dihydrofolate reductase n=1 Tax=Blattabacterium cuenoti TaxID=1653831 RepID=UPI00163C33D9|nr:dihydrofolate reductase [Blattabacterium cuenoti]
MKIILIASVSKNGFIGKKNKLMWNLPNDLKRFKKLTLGKPIVMGRKTFDSIGKILPERNNIILTRNKNFLLKKIKIIHSEEEIYKLPYKKIYIIGGEQLYHKMIKIASLIELTLVHKNFNGDSKFPKIEKKYWKKIKESFCKKDEKHLYNYSFITLEKINLKIN